jgi:hypothetical protein
VFCVEEGNEVIVIYDYDNLAQYNISVYVGQIMLKIDLSQTNNKSMTVSIWRRIESRAQEMRADLHCFETTAAALLVGADPSRIANFMQHREHR